MPSPNDDERPDSRAGERIAKLLARAGVASRREIERMIAEGRVAKNGVALETPATLLRSLHGITVDGQPVAAPAPARLFLYHKPPGLLVTERDPAGRTTIYDRLPSDLPRVVPVGRLDLATEGLLLLTTDGGLKRQLELPATGVERTYRARAYGDITQDRLEALIDGIEIEGIRYGPIDANMERRTGANGWLELTLTEGKNREVRRVLEHLGLQVSRLIRTRYGPFVLGDLQPGELGEVRQVDLIGFRRALAAKRPKVEERVAVTARVAGPGPVPQPARPEPARAEQDRPREPRERDGRAGPTRPAKPATGWGTRARPSRPAGRGEGRGDAQQPGESRPSGAKGRADDDGRAVRHGRARGDGIAERTAVSTAYGAGRGGGSSSDRPNGPIRSRRLEERSRAAADGGTPRTDPGRRRDDGRDERSAIDRPGRSGGRSGASRPPRATASPSAPRPPKPPRTPRPPRKPR